MKKLFYLILPLASVMAFSSCSHQMTSGIQASEMMTVSAAPAAIADENEKVQNLDIPNTEITLVQSSDEAVINLITQPVNSRHRIPAPIKRIVNHAAESKLMNKVTNLVDTQPQVKKAEAAAPDKMLDNNLKLALVFIVLAIIFGLIGIQIFQIIAAVLLIVGLIFLLLWILDL